jgi:hypothetical protein
MHYLGSGLFCCFLLAMVYRPSRSDDVSRSPRRNLNDDRRAVPTCSSGVDGCRRVPLPKNMPFKMLACRDAVGCTGFLDVMPITPPLVAVPRVVVSLPQSRVLGSCPSSDALLGPVPCTPRGAFPSSESLSGAVVADGVGVPAPSTPLTHMLLRKVSPLPPRFTYLQIMAYKRIV